MYRIVVKVSNNFGESRHAPIFVAYRGKRVTQVSVKQASGELVQAQQTELLSLALNVESQIALKVIASKIAELPPPAQAAAVSAVNGMIPAIAAGVAQVRASFSAVPAPAAILTNSPELQTPTDKLIAVQAKLALKFFNEQVIKNE
ncbi:MAG: hypothetical protein AAF493_07665 [Pseudomonadota bacterium]